jgi:hypothetical protein
VQRNLKLKSRKAYHPYENAIKIIEGIVNLKKVDLSILRRPNYEEFGFIHKKSSIFSEGSQTAC